MLSYPCFLSSIVLAAIAVLLTSPASGAVFVVDSLVDAVDVSPGDTACATAGGACTLRAAIQEANALVGDDVVSLPAGTYVLGIPAVEPEDPSDADGAWYLNSTLEITGAGAGATILDADMLDRAVEVGFGADVTITDLTLRNGSRSAIRSSGDLLLRRVVVELSQGASNYGGPGGIENTQANLVLEDSIVQNNTGTFSAGGIWHQGTSLELIRSVVQGNTGQNNAGGVVSRGTFFATDTVFRDNAGPGAIGGGAMSCDTGVADFERVAFIDNDGNHGAGLYVTGCDATLTNVTLSGNDGQNSGAVENVGGTVALLNVTATNNSAYGLRQTGGTMTVMNTIVAGNSFSALSQCRADSGMTSLGHNVDEGAACVFDQESDLSNTDPLLGDLDEAGSTPVHPLLAGSPAIDSGSDAGCPEDDQLGNPRPFDGDGNQTPTCDRGAVEFVPEPSAELLAVAALGSLTALLTRKRRR